MAFGEGVSTAGLETNLECSDPLFGLEGDETRHQLALLLEGTDATVRHGVSA